MLKIISFILSLFVVNNLFSQLENVTIKFEVDGKAINLKDNFKLYFVKSNDTTFASVENDRIRVPQNLRAGEKIKLIFTVGKYFLDFNSFTLVINEQNPTWKIGVDEKPFNKKEYWTVKKWERVKLIYYINNGNGGRLLVTKYS